MTFLKFILSLSIFSLFYSCGGGNSQEKIEDPNLILFSGKIENSLADTIGIYHIETREFQGSIQMVNGSFNDTLEIEQGFYQMVSGENFFPLYIEKGYHIDLQANGTTFFETAQFSGKGEKPNNYFLTQMKKDQAFFELLDDKIISRDSIISRSDKYKTESLALLAEAEINDSSLFTHQKDQITSSATMLIRFYDESKKIDSMIGLPSPSFNYENVDGGMTALNDLKGKYVFIDVWATWCGPCIGEIPSLQILEEKYHDKNIEFVSLSIDNMDNKEKWKEMIAEMELGGIQIIAPDAWKSDFVKAYNISGIPRFILIDPNGNVVDGDTPRPSEEALSTLLDELLL